MTDEQPKNGTTNGHIQNAQPSIPPLLRPAWRALIQDFTPLWFTWCMNSGILGILTHQCPYQFSGLKTISSIFYVIDLALFIAFSIIFILRFAIFRKHAYTEVTTNPADLMICACWPIAFMTLTTLTGLIASNSYWGGYAFTIVSYVMWWIEVAWSLLFLFWIFITLIRNKAATSRLPTLIILPAVSVSTAAVTGGLIVSLSYEVSPTLAVPVIIVGFMLVGIGFLLGLILSTFLFYALLSQGWPPAAQTTSVFVFIGPVGQSAAALQALGSAASKYGAFRGYDKGTFLTAEAAKALSPGCVFLALMMTGLGLIWLVFSIYLMIERAFARELKWAHNWNSIIFPTATLVTSLNLLSIEMDSPAFRVLTTAFIIVLVGFFLMNTVFTGIGIAKGELLIVKEDPRVRKMIEDGQKEK